MAFQILVRPREEEEGCNLPPHVTSLFEDQLQ